MTNREMTAAQRALIDWFQSHGIDPLDAATLMTHTVGQIIGVMSLKNPAARREALLLLQRQMIADADVD